MITDIHEKIREAIRKDINQPNTNNIIADFMSYSLPYSQEDAQYTEDMPWGRIAKRIKEDPNVLKSRDMAYAISAGFRSSNKIYALDEYNFALDMMEKLKKLKEDGIITEKQFQETLSLKSPETGETLLTQIMKDCLNLTRGKSNIKMLNRLIETGVDVNVPNARGQYPLQIIEHYQNIRKKNIEYSVEKGLVSRDFVSEDYTFPKEKKLIEEKTSKETLEKIKENTKVNLAYKKTQKKRAYVTESDRDISTWKENGPQGYAYAINVVQPTYLSEDSWSIDTIILPGRYVIYEGRGEEQQLIPVESFYKKQLTLYLIENKKLKAVEGGEILRTLAGGSSEKAITMLSAKTTLNTKAKASVSKIKKQDMTKIKDSLKQLEGASDKLFKRLKGKIFKKAKN